MECSRRRLCPFKPGHFLDPKFQRSPNLCQLSTTSPITQQKTTSPVADAGEGGFVEAVHWKGKVADNPCVAPGRRYFRAHRLIGRGCRSNAVEGEGLLLLNSWQPLPFQ